MLHIEGVEVAAICDKRRSCTEAVARRHGRTCAGGTIWT
jgi:hypothetical protein